MEINLLDVKKEIEDIPSHLFNNSKKNKVSKIKLLKINRKNINIYFVINNKEYIFRINIKGINSNSFKKSKKEFNLINIINKYYNKSNKTVYFSKKGKYVPYSYIVITFIKGKEININSKNIKILAKEISKINNIKISFIDRLLLDKQNYNKLISEFEEKEDYIEQKIPDIYKIYKEIKDKILLKKPPGINKDNFFMHGDLNYRNIIERKNKLYFIDWEYLKIGNPLLDIAKLSFAKNFNKFENIFLKTYTKHFKQIDNIYEKYLFYKDLQKYLWLITDTQYFLNSVFENNKFKIQNKNQNIKDIFINYNYFKEKKYTNVNETIFMKKLKISEIKF